MLTLYAPTHTPEDGTIKYDDVPAETLQALIKGMLITKQNRTALQEIKLFDDIRVDKVIGLLDFSSRLLMPWIGVCCAHNAVEESSDVGLLLRVVSHTPSFGDAEEEADYWREVVDLAASRIAADIHKAIASPTFAKMGEYALGKVVACMQPGGWISDTFTIASTGNESAANAQGHCLQLGRAKEEQLDVFVKMQPSMTDRLFKIGSKKVSMVEAAVTAKATTGSDRKRSFDVVVIK